MDMKGRHLLSLRDFSPAEISFLLNLARDLKAKKQGIGRGEGLSGKNFVLLFEKSSTRTRCAFEVAAFDEGARVSVLTDSHVGKKESIEDTAKVLSRYYDGIAFRGFEHSTCVELASHSSVPVWNALSDEYHPTQVLADLLTIQEQLAKPLAKVKMVYVGDARNNVASSLMVAATKMGMNFTTLGPRELFPAQELVAKMRELAVHSGAVIEVSDSIDLALQAADVVYTDVWVSMGEEELFAERIKLLTPYRVTMEMLKASGNNDLLFLHCLPAFHDTRTDTGREMEKKFAIQEMEVSDEVFRSSHSVVFDEAENRLHSIKAVMLATIG